MDFGHMHQNKYVKLYYFLLSGILDKYLGLAYCTLYNTHEKDCGMWCVVCDQVCCTFLTCSVLHILWGYHQVYGVHYTRVT